MSLVIECDSCNSRYRLDLALVKGHGIRVACRKCGAAIIVLSSEVATLSTKEPKAAQASDPRPEPARNLPKEVPPAPPPASDPGSLSFPELAAPKEIPKRPVFLLPAQPPWFLHPPLLPPRRARRLPPLPTSSQEGPRARRPPRKTVGGGGPPLLPFLPRKAGP